VVLTHLSEVLRNNLAQLLSYKDMRALVDRLEPEYRKLLDEISPSQISFSNLQAVLKLLLAERVSIRNLHLILEAIAEVSPFMRKTEMIVEHVRARMAPQICGDLTEGDVLKILRLGHKWESAFHQALRRDAKGDVIEFDFEPRAIEEFSNELTRSVQKLLDEGHQFVIVCGADVRPYVRMVTERLFPTLPVLSHIEVARGIHVKSMGAVA
jgi:flagellar biosynthesis protein FlhA